jgi:DnaJ like chaperone protein
MFDPISFGIGYGLWKLGEYIYKEVNSPETPPDPRKSKEVEELTPEPIYFAVAILAKFAKADGIVTKNEIATIEGILRDIELTGEKRTKAIGIFSKHKNGALTYEESLSIFAELTEDSDDLRGALCILLLRLAHADGQPPQHAINGVQQACDAFDMDYIKLTQVFQEIEQQKRASVAIFYETLGCSANDSVDAIKKRYRYLTKTFHPDTIAGKELPPEFIKVAEAKFLEIQNAYEQIMSLRNATNS